MPPKKPNDAGAKQIYKVGTQIKDVIPPSVKNPPRETRQIKPPEAPNKKLQPDYIAYADPEEWPGDEAVRDLNYNEAVNTKAHFETDGYVVFWRRPRHFLRKRYPENSDYEPPYMPVEDRYKFNDDRYSTRIEREEQVQYMQNEIDGQLSICESYEREETQDEVEQRRKEFQAAVAAAALTKKKGGKKVEEVFDEGLQKVKDVRLSDVVCQEYMPPDARWIASQLQVIKDREIRDCNTQRALSSKIYPQKDGAPVYNPSGKYIVKLYFMGKERKVMISDHMPVNYEGKAMLPYSTVETQLWPLLVSKAVLQLWEFQSQGSLVGDGFVMYSLMGLLSESLNLKQMSWQIVDQMLSEQRYNAKDVFVQAYGFQSQSERNTLSKSKKEYQSEVLRNPKKVLDNYEQPRKAPLAPQATDREEDSPRMEQEEVQPQSAMLPSITEFRRRNSVPRDTVDPSQTNLNTCFAYSLIEQFSNDGGFNLVYAQKRSERELRLRQEYYDICKTPITKMNKEEKLEHRRRKKEIREKLQEDDKKRIALITQQPVKHRFLRLKSNIQGRDPVLIFSSMGADELYLARKCITNKLNKPPNYDIPELKGDDKSVVSQTVKVTDDSFSVKALDDFTGVNNVQEPFQRGEGGFWVHEKEFLSLFEHVQICYDPRKLNPQAVQLPANPDLEFTNYDQMEMIIVQRDPDQEENIQVQLLTGFQAKYASNIDMNTQIRPYALLQRFDLEQYESVHDYKLLNQCVSAQMIILDNKNHIFRLNVYSPLNFTMWLCSTNKVQTLSIADYLVDYEGYQVKPFSVDHPACEANKHFLFFRFKIILNSTKEHGSFAYRVKSKNDNALLRFIKLKLCEVPALGTQQMLTTIEGVHKNLLESEAILCGTQRFQIKSGVAYYFLLEGTPPYNTAEGGFEMDFITNQDLQIQLLDQVEPTRYADKYIPTKYGILFRERIFANEAMCTIFMRLTEGQAQQAQQQAIKGKPGKGPADVEIVETQMKGDRLIKLELLYGDDVLVYSYGINSAVLSNVMLTKDEQYILQASFDLREWPEAMKSGEETDNIYWFTTIYSSDTVALVKDTSKEDREKAIKKGWEEKEPGRAANAKKSRSKYMLTQKEELTEEEQAILNAPRLTKKQREEEAKQAAAKKGPKKDDKKGSKQTKVEVVEQVQQRVPPKSEAHVNETVNEFLSHLEQDRIMDHYARHAGLINVRNEVQKREIVEGILMGKEQVTAILQRNLKMREEVKLLQKDQKDTMIAEYNSSRTQLKEGYQEILQKREQIRSEFQQIMKREQQIFDLCKSDKIGNPDDLEKLLIEGGNQIDITLVNAARQVMQNWKIATIQDKINVALGNFDVDTLKICLDQIVEMKIDGIDITAAEDMIDEASGNPNFLAEKQAELKKQGKKPAKK